MITTHELSKPIFGVSLMVNFVCAFILLVNVSSGALTDDATAGQNNPDQVSFPELKASDELKKLIAAIRLEEDRYQDYATTVRTSQELDSPDPNQDDLQGTARISISHLTNTNTQRIKGPQFTFVSDHVAGLSSGDRITRRRQTVFDGTKTISVNADSSATVSLRSAEPHQLLPPHCWGIFHFKIGAPLSTYLSGTDALRSHPKVAHYPVELGTNHELSKVEAEVVGEERIELLDCTIVRVQCWHTSGSELVIQYLWLARNRNFHVARSRTANVRNGVEYPHLESVVKKWRKGAADVWYPKLVEVRNISPEAIAKKASDKILERLTIENVELNPKPTEAEFRLPEIPESLPRFAINEKGILIDSPHHPTPLKENSSTTIESILERLAEEEKQYDPCDIKGIIRYDNPNSQEILNDMTSRIETRLRTVLDGPRRYRFGEESRTPFVGSFNSTVNFQAFDGATYRFFSQTLVSNVGDESPTSVIIGLASPRPAMLLLRAHTLVFGNFGTSVRDTLAEYLRYISPKLGNRQKLKVEYICDEQIDDLFCHKLQCRLMSQNNFASDRYFLLWLARDRNLIPIRHESHNANLHLTLPTSVSYAEDLREIRPGVWFPFRATNLAFDCFGQEGLGFGQIALQSKNETTIDGVTLEPVTNVELFSDVTIEKGVSVSVHGENGQGLGQYSQPETGKLEISAETLQSLRDQIKENQELREQEKKQALAETDVPLETGHGRFADTRTGHLLHELEQRNAGPSCFRDAWCRTIKAIVDIGSDAVPELIQELDATDNERMLRCLGFILRAIKDQRAVPALIRAIPKTLRKPGSDMRFTAQDADLLKFAKQHALDKDNISANYTFGRPVREICGALRELTGKQFGEETLFLPSLAGLPADKREKRKAFYEVAKKWADWWDQNSSELISDENFRNVLLPPFSTSTTPKPMARFETRGELSGMLLQSIFSPESKRVFYDIDTGQFAELPEKWRGQSDLESKQDEIIAWVQSEGYDLMGTESVSDNDGQRVFVIRGIGLEAWERGPEQLKQTANAVTLEMLKEGRRSAADLLIHHDTNTDKDVPGEKTSFLVVTREGTVAFLFVGVEVRDDSEKPGHFFIGDRDLNPRSTSKGRRFSLQFLHEME